MGILNDIRMSFAEDKTVRPKYDKLTTTIKRPGPAAIIADLKKIEYRQIRIAYSSATPSFPRRTSLRLLEG